MLDEEGRVLLIRRDDILTWALPGGALEPAELSPEGVVREVEEETGLSVRLTDLSGVYLKPAEHSLIFTFLAEVVGGKLTTGPETAAFDYFAAGSEPVNTLPKQVKRAADVMAERETTTYRIRDGLQGLEQMGLLG